jgi:diamine N-acetyltransferase
VRFFQELCEKHPHHQVCFLIYRNYQIKFFNTLKSVLLPIELSEVSLLSSLAKEFYLPHYTHLWLDGGKSYAEYSFSEEKLKREMSYQTSAFYWIQLDNQPVGFLKLRLDEALPTPPQDDALQLERLYLRQGTTGGGIGSEVMNFVKQVAKQNQKKWIWLNVMDSSPAIQFYQKHGFETFDKVQLEFEAMKQEFRGLLRMRLALD